MNTTKYDELWCEIKKFLTLQYDYAKLTAIEKLIILLSAIALSAVMLILVACVLFYLSFALVYWISDLLKCTWAAYLIVSGLFLVLTIVVYAMRKSLILDPVARFLTKLFLTQSK